MLTRMAESLFWVDRYTERADDTARILDVTLHNVLEGSNLDASVVLAELCHTMGIDVPPEGLSPAAVTEALAYSDDGSSSIVASVRSAREAARGVRQAISAELWECLNATHYEMPSAVTKAASMGPHSLFRYTKERAALTAGLADSTMSRDEGWHFLVLGRNLERVDMTARLLLASHHGTGGQQDWATTLRCCSAHEAYLKTYQSPPSARPALEFLLTSRSFPRSIYFALSSAEQAASAALNHNSRHPSQNPALRLLGGARAWLEFSETDALVASLPNALGRLQQACAEASDLLWGASTPQERCSSWASEPIALSRVTHLVSRERQAAETS